MKDLLKRFFTPDPGPAEGASDDAPAHDIRVATCALVHKLATLLKIEHRYLVAAKLEVLKQA